MPASDTLTRPTTAAARGRRSAIMLVTACLVGGSALGAAPAHAASLSGGSDFATLQDAIIVSEMVLSGPDVITLDPGATITAPDGSVEGISEDLTIDLNGGSVSGLRLLITSGTVTLTNGTWVSTPAADAGLVAPGIGVGPSATLVLDSVTVTATGSECDAGIGGWYSEPGSGTTCDGGSSIDAGAITIVDSTVTATGGSFSAGIGGASRSTHGTLTITRSTVTATGGEFGAAIGAGKDRTAGIITLTDSVIMATGTRSGAGIGGSDRGNGGTLTIDGGEVTAYGASTAAAIGGGFAGNAGTTTILGDAVVVAQAGSLAAGIGGGIYGAGGTTTISGTADVTAIGRDGGAGIGEAFNPDVPGSTTISGSPVLRTTGLSGAVIVEEGATPTLFGATNAVMTGTVTNRGTLSIAEPSRIYFFTGAGLVNEGRLEGAGRLSGSGTLTNNGAICSTLTVDDIALDTAEPPSGLTVEGTVYYLPFRDPSGSLLGGPTYAPTLAEACRTLDDLSTPDEVNVGWTAGIGGPFVGDETLLAEVVGIETGIETILEPVLVDAALTIEPGATSSAAGEVVTIAVRGPRPLSNELSSDLTTDALLSGTGIELGSTPGSFTTTSAGETTVTATVTQSSDAGDRVMTADIVHTTTPAALEELTVAASAQTVRQGSSVTLEVDRRRSPSATRSSSTRAT